MADRRPSGPGLDGILVVDKPAGPTSHDVVALVRRLAATRRVGHGGTLDPFASGVLPVFLGRATRVVEYHLGDRKAYRATIAFGASSTTDDLEGELTPAEGPPPSGPAVEAALAAFVGRITQVPPAYSAIKVGGRRAYAMARAGQSVDLASREVDIERLELVAWNADDPASPIAVIDVHCSAGTYVRALARDIGAAVGSAAYLAALIRMASGPFRLDQAVALDAVRAAGGEGSGALERLLLPIDTGLDGFATIELNGPEVDAIAKGQHVLPSAGAPGTSDPVRLVGPAGELVGFGRVRNGRVAPDKVLVTVPAPAVVPAGKPEGPAEIDLDADDASEQDPPASVDPDPATPDDV